MRRSRILLRLACIVMLIAAHGAFSRAAAQDILGQARTAPTRADGIRMLELHLAAQPNDVDARLLYGLMLSWEARYDEARRELERVLAAAPEYLDARVALMNVEWWSGRHAEARALSDAILLRDPGHAQARLVRQRLDARDRPWSAGAGVALDTFSDGRDAWHEQLLTISRQTAAGSVLVRGSRAERFDRDDQQVEIEFYPVFRPGTYAFIGGGLSNDHTLYPEHRFGFDLYQSLGGGFEASAGYRRLGFATAANIVTGSLTKYHGQWMFTARAQRVTVADAGGENAASLQARRYFGASGTSFAGAVYTRGRHREEIRGTGDLFRGTTDSVRGELDTQVSPHWRLQLSARGAREKRATGDPVWQTTLAGGVAVRF